MLRPSTRHIWVLLALVVCSVSGWLYLREPDVTWATDENGWDGWKKDVVEMRAKRTQKPMIGYLHSELVEWDGYYDMQGAKLLDGRVMHLDTTKLQFDIIYHWSKGRKLYLCYDEKRGATLLDAETLLQVPVRYVSDKHPIDNYITSLNAQSTYEMMSAGYEGIRLWCLEIDRSVREVLALEYLPADVRTDFIQLTKVRMDYCRLQSQFASGAVYATFPGGTIRGPLSADAGYTIYRDTYYTLADCYFYYSSYDNKPPTDDGW
jgi:hypothetical protein